MCVLFVRRYDEDHLHILWRGEGEDNDDDKGTRVMMIDAPRSHYWGTFSCNFYRQQNRELRQAARKMWHRLWSRQLRSLNFKRLLPFVCSLSMVFLKARGGSLKTKLSHDKGDKTNCLFTIQILNVNHDGKYYNLDGIKMRVRSRNLFCRHTFVCAFGHVHEHFGNTNLQIGIFTV